MKNKRIVCVDFDGVIHSYTSPWVAVDVIKDPPVSGAFEWLEDVLDSDEFRPVVYSSRSKHLSAVAAMKAWFMAHGFTRVGELEFPTQKPPAFLTVDDRGFLFEGQFPTLRYMREFKPWNKK